MRIFLHDYGAYAFTLQIANAWAKSGHTVYYSFSKSTQYVKRASEAIVTPGLTIECVTLSKPYYKYSFIQRFRAEIEHGNRVADQIRHFHPDVIFSANTPLDSQRLIQIAGKKEKVKFVFWFQDAISLAIEHTMHGKWLFAGDLIGIYYQELEKNLLRSSDKVILISDDFQPLMDQWKIAPQKRIVLPNWMPLDEIAPVNKQNNWAIEHDFANKFCFIYTGILGLKHNPQVFIQLAEHFAAHSDINVVVVSEGEKAEELKALTAEHNLNNLLVLPFQPNEVYAQVLGTADVLVSIINNDAGSYSVPSKVLTYLCSGKPVLLSSPSDNAAAKMILEADAGLTSAPEQMDRFLKNAQQLYENNKLRESMGAKGRAYAEKQFDLQKIMDQFKTLLV